MVLLLSSVLLGVLFWSLQFAEAWDRNVGRMLSTIDSLIERAYGAAVPKKDEK